MAYQSSDHCATGFLDRPLHLRMPELIPNFNAFDASVRAAGVPRVTHPAGAILAYDGLTVHWATPATTSGMTSIRVAAVVTARTRTTARTIGGNPTSAIAIGTTMRERSAGVQGPIREPRIQTSTHAITVMTHAGRNATATSASEP
jgi:hypothetical protein